MKLISKTSPQMIKSNIPPLPIIIFRKVVEMLLSNGRIIDQLHTLIFKNKKFDSLNQTT